MKVILLSAGLGSRLKPITDSIPKCLVSINGIPLMKIWIETLISCGLKDILVNIHHMPEKVLDFFGDQGYQDLVHVVHEPILLGTAGTIFANTDFIGDGPVMVIHADNLSKFDIPAFIDAHKNRPKFCEVTMMLFKTDSPSSCGVVELNDENVVVNFFEKVPNPPSNLANGAVYIFESELIRQLMSLDEKITDISTEVIPRLVGKINTFMNDCYHRDIGTVQSLELAQGEYRKYQ